MKRPKVLTVTKRPGNLCAAKAMFDAAGFDVITATNVQAAVSVSRSVRVEAAFICRHSFTDAERDQITAALMKANPESLLLGRCPGCIGYDEAAGQIGKIEDMDAMSGLIAAITYARRPSEH